MTLGSLIEKLEKCKNQESHVYFVFGSMKVGHLTSYRGFYEQLALTTSKSDKTKTVEELLKICKEAVGGLFEGYKGGTYTAGLDSEVWASDWGFNTSCTIKDVIDKEYAVYLETCFQDW